jgi:lysozyme
MTDALDIATPMIRRHEGLRLKPYKCTANKTTIGYGRNLDDVGVSRAEAESMLAVDIDACVADLETFPYWAVLTESRKAALIDLRFNLGGQGFRKFKKMGFALAAGEYQVAGDELMDSRYAAQVGGRANEIAGMLRDG